MAFEGLTDKLQNAFKKLSSRGKLSESDVKAAMKEVRLALLEADVNYKVVKDFIKKVTERAVGTEILESLTPAQQVIKIVNEELAALMGGTNARLTYSSQAPTVYMLCGLQGAGKTTMAAKLGRMFKKDGKKPMLVACDVYRPAAIRQLQVVGQQAGVEVFEKGQGAVTVADTFNSNLGIDGVILTKLDGDTRGGAAISVRAVTGKPIKFAGIGEKLDGIEPFHPDRMASRILGMGDVMSLIEKAQDTFDEQAAIDLTRKMRTNSFTLEDYLEQMQQMGKMGSIRDVLGMIPGMSGKINDADIDEEKIAKAQARNMAIIRSMTRMERRNPDILNASRKRRVAAGSGATVQEVNLLLKQFDQARGMMKQFMGMGKKGRLRFPFGKMRG